MNELELFGQLGVSPMVLEYFNSAFRIVSQDSMFFRQRAGQECPCPLLCYGAGFDNVCWTFGQSNPVLVSRIIVCTSPLEAVSWLHFHYFNFANFEGLLFIAAGDIPGKGLYDRISGALKRKRVVLIMGGDLFGRICDIKTAVRLAGRECAVRLTSADQVLLNYRDKVILLREDKLTLNAFEAVTGLRSGIRTYKPKGYPTFFHQLLGDKSWFVVNALGPNDFI